MLSGRAAPCSMQLAQEHAAEKRSCGRPRPGWAGPWWNMKMDKNTANRHIDRFLDGVLAAPELEIRLPQTVAELEQNAKEWSALSEAFGIFDGCDDHSFQRCPEKVNLEQSLQLLSVAAENSDRDDVRSTHNKVSNLSKEPRFKAFRPKNV